MSLLSSLSSTTLQYINTKYTHVHGSKTLRCCHMSCSGGLRPLATPTSNVVEQYMNPQKYRGAISRLEAKMILRLSHVLFSGHTNKYQHLSLDLWLKKNVVWPNGLLWRSLPFEHFEISRRRAICGSLKLRKRHLTPLRQNYSSTRPCLFSPTLEPSIPTLYSPNTST